MFLRYFLDLPFPFEEAQRRLLERPKSWLPGLARDAEDRGERLLALEIAALGPNRTQLSISARYRPPLGAVGRALDRALMHRVAEATMKDFVDRVGEALQSEAPARD